MTTSDRMQVWWTRSHGNSLNPTFTPYTGVTQTVVSSIGGSTSITVYSKEKVDKIDEEVKKVAAQVDSLDHINPTWPQEPTKKDTIHHQLYVAHHVQKSLQAKVDGIFTEKFKCEGEDAPKSIQERFSTISTDNKALDTEIRKMKPAILAACTKAIEEEVKEITRLEVEKLTAELDAAKNQIQDLKAELDKVKAEQEQALKKIAEQISKINERFSPQG